MTAYPTRGSSLRNAIGNKVPPREEPIATMPSARPRRRLNQWDTTLTAGPKLTPLASFGDVSGGPHSDGDGTHADQKALAQDKVPELGALGDDEGRADQHHAGEEQR
jgi:hypothetical protein